MLFPFLLCFMIITTESAERTPEMKPSDRVVVKLDPVEVVRAFKSVVSSDYLRQLAQDIATRAAGHLLSEMKNKQPLTEVVPSSQSPYVAKLQSIHLSPYPIPTTSNNAAMKEEVIQEIERTPSEHLLPSDFNTSIIDVQQAMTLLTEPSPDGDNLDLISPNLSDDEEDPKENRKGTAVIQLLKVNGKYFRRLLGYV